MIVAMNEAMLAMKENKVWVQEDLPEGRKSIPTCWILKYKTNAKGEIERHRARLVAKGDKQKSTSK